MEATSEERSAAHRASRHLPEGFRSRAVTMDDAGEVAELINASSIADVAAPSASREIVAGWFGRPSLDLEEDVVLVVSDDGTPAAYVDFDPQPDRAEIFFDGYVHPHFRRRGLGSALVRYAEEKSRATLAERHDGNGVMTTWTHAAATDAIELFDRQGMREIRRSYRMAVDLDQGALANPAWPPGVTVTTFDPERDAHAAYDSHNEGFTDHWNFSARDFDTWIWDVVGSGRFEPDLAFVARAGDEIVGGAICEQDREDPLGGFVEMLWVRPAWRRRGIALALLLHAFAEFAARGSVRASLGVDAQSRTGALELYARAGMRPVRESVIFEKELGPEL